VKARDVWEVAPFFLLAGLLGLVTVWFTKHEVIGSYVIRTDGFWSRLAVAGWAVWFYLYKAILPLHLLIVYPRWQIDPRIGWVYVPLLLLIAALAALWHWRRAAGNGLFFALAYFVVMLLPVLGFLNIAFMRFSLVADHWEYFSIIAPIAVAGALIKKPWVGAALLLTLGALTWNQCGMYASAETLWRTTIDHERDSWVAQCELGTILRERGQAREAMGCFEKALEINPNYGKAHSNLAYALLVTGRTGEAIAQFEKAVEIEPTDPAPASNLAWLLASCPDRSLRNGARAVELARRADALTGGDKPIVLHTLAAAYAEAGQFPAAVETAQRALKLAEAQSNAWLSTQLQRELKLYQAGQPFLAPSSAR